MRRTVVIALVLGLLVGALAGAADAKKKKKKPKPKPPITYSVDGSFAQTNMADFFVGGGVTRNEFLATCAIPKSQRVDGYVIELPAAFAKISSDAELYGSDVTGGHDLDMYFFDAACEPAGEASTTAYDEVGVIAAGTKYVLVSGFVGTQLEFTFKAVEKR